RRSRLSLQDRSIRSPASSSRWMVSASGRRLTVRTRRRRTRRPFSSRTADRRAIMTLRTNQPGFALPMAILVIGFMTAGVLAAFARTSAEVQIVDDQTVETRAFANAERGLGQFLATGSVPTSPTTATYAFGGPDTAYITAVQMRAAASPTDTAIWLVSSTGRV